MHSDNLKSVLKSWILLEATRFKKEMGENQPRWRDKLIQYEEAGGYYVHFSDVPKMGLFIRNRYGTPIGLYTYPLHKELMRDFAVDRPYALIVKPKPEARLLDLRSHSEQALSADIQRLIGMGYSFESMREAASETRYKSPGGKLWNITRVLSGADKADEFLKKVGKEKDTRLPTKGGGPTGVWTMLFRKLGYDGVVDSAGEGIIHHAEPDQAVFFDTTKLELVEVIVKDTKESSVTNLFRKNLVGQNLEGKKFDGQNLEGARIFRSILTSASFVGARMVDAILSRTLLAKADFAGANLDGAVFRYAKGDKTSFRNAKIHGTDFRDTIFHNSAFSSAIAPGILFRQADLSASDFAGADLDSADFTDANLQNGNMKGAILRDAVFIRANLDGAILQGADVENANFRGANLQGADLTGTYLWQATVSGATYNKKTKFQRGFDPVASGMKLVETPT